MAAAPETQFVTITINDVELQVPKGELIVEAVKRLGLEIPIFCYHSRMKAVGMCRMCLVEVGFKGPDGVIKKMPKPQAGCTLPASDGMAIYTDTEMVHKDRKGVLEFLLINHPLDCPICDRGGECPLQNNTLFYGPSTSRFVELKRHLPKAFPLSKYVTLDLERCIQCGRCVRFTEEISGDAQLAFRFRGATMQPSTFEMTDFDSKFSGNVIEICPVGALTNAEYRFRARPWDLETKPAVCTVCSNGCNIWFDYRVNKMVRINGRTNEAINEEWTCDRGKFGHEFYNGDKRLTKPLVRRGDALVQASWPEVYDEIIRAFSAGGNQVGAIGGIENSNEDLFMLQRLFRKHFKSDNLDFRFESQLPDAQHFAGLNLTHRTIASYEGAPVTMVFGSSLADEVPILFLRLRKAWFNNGAKIIVASDRPTDADSFADLVLRYKPGTELTLAQALSGSNVQDAAEITGVPAEKIAKAVLYLKEQRVPIIVSRLLYNLPDATNVAEALAKAGNLGICSLRANDQGCPILGVFPLGLEGLEKGLGTHETLRRCESGQLKALWLLGVDPFAELSDKDFVRRAMENTEFLVVQAHSENEAFPYASVVLPMCAPAEMDGTYTNIEARIQRMDQVLPVKGDAKPAWRVFSELALRIGGERPFFNAGEIMAEVVRQVPAFAGVDYARLVGTEGSLLNVPR